MFIINNSKFKTIVYSNHLMNDKSQALTLEVKAPVSECALDIPGNVCSTKAVIGVLSAKLKDKGVPAENLQTSENIMDYSKKSEKCETEKCVLKKLELTSDVKESLLRIKPQGPANDTSLLNNENIDNVLNRLVHVHKDFYHMNFQMIDFDGEKKGCGWKVINGIYIIPTELGTIDMVDNIIDKGYKTFGVVLNTDKRTGGGIHWFALFCDFRISPHTIEYFNSSGNKPVRQVQDWLIKTKTRIDQVYKSTIVVLSGLVHQKDSDTECGLYSLYFLWNRVNGIPVLNFNKKRIPDAVMIKFRRMCFNTT